VSLLNQNTQFFRQFQKTSSNPYNYQSPVNNTSNLPWLVCGTRLVTWAWLLSAQLNQTPGLYAVPGL